MRIVQFWFSNADNAWLFADNQTGELLLVSNDCQEINLLLNDCSLKYVRKQCDMQVDWC